MAVPGDRIEPLLETWAPILRDAFLTAVYGLRNRIEIAKLVKLLQDGDVNGALQAVGLDPVAFRPLGQALEQVFEAGGLDATAGIKPTRGPLGIRIYPLFDVSAPSAGAWIRQHSDELIQQITDDQRALIRAAMEPLWNGVSPLVSGQTPQKIALDLVGRISSITGNREGGIIGLTAQQAEWARNYQIELGDVQAGIPPDPNALTRVLRDRRFDSTVQRAIRDGTPIPDETRRAMVANYRNRALAFRGETIAQNEASTALHQSQIEAWDQAIKRGAVEEVNVRRFWITAGDERVRVTHAAVPLMNPTGVPLRGVFMTPLGPTLQPGWGFDPGCRCRIRIRVVEPAVAEPA